MIEDLAMNLMLTILKSVVKNPRKKSALKAKMLKVRDAINAVYGEE